MTRKMQYTCDRCGNVIVEGLRPYLLDLGRQPVMGLVCANDTDCNLFDMCPTCWGKLIEFMKAGLSQKTK